jgi:membrane protease YdiL (CAAX protease family)
MKSNSQIEDSIALPSFRSLKLIEPLAFCAYVALFIWKLQEAYWYSWIVFPLWMISSFVLHGDTPKTIGWRADNLWTACKQAALVVVPMMLGLVVLGAFLGAFHRPVGHLFSRQHLLGYMSFCLLQQVALNSYVTNRFLEASLGTVKASLLSGAIFAALHWPNPVLVPLTAIGGAIMAWLFARERNILPLAFAQGIMGTLIWWAFPVAWHHAMRVGPGFYHFHLH